MNNEILKNSRVYVQKCSWSTLASLTGVIALICYPYIVTLPFHRHLMVMIFLYAILGQAWNILGGFAGQISLGQAVFFGIGAYTSALLQIHIGLSPWIGIIVGVLVALIVAHCIGFICFNLGGHYFVIATLAIGEIARTLILNCDAVGGAVGLMLPLLGVTLVGFQFESKLPYYFLFLALAILTFAVAMLIEKSKLGYYFRAIKADPDAALSLGISTRKYKLIALYVSAVITAIGGSFYGHYVLYVDPFSVFTLKLSLLIALIAVLGGIGTLWGPLIGAAFLVPMSEYSRIWFSGGGRAVDLMIYGGLIVLISVFQPKGIIGLLNSFKRGGH